MTAVLSNTALKIIKLFCAKYSKNLRTIGNYLPVVSYTSWKIYLYKSGRNSQLGFSTSKLPLKPLAPAEASTTYPLKEMLLHDKSINAF